MTMRSAIEGGRKAPKVTKLELHKETIRKLTESEAEIAAGGRKVKTLALQNSCIKMLCRSKACETVPPNCASGTCPRRTR